MHPVSDGHRFFRRRDNPLRHFTSHHHPVQEDADRDHTHTHKLWYLPHRELSILQASVPSPLPSDLTRNRCPLCSTSMCRQLQNKARRARTQRKIGNSITGSWTENGVEFHGGEEKSPDEGRIYAHYVFLVHGWLGNEMELSYLEHAIHASLSKSGKEVVVRNARCNNKNTSDGIEAGGKRLAREVQSFVVDHTLQKRQMNCSFRSQGQNEYHATISFVGYSLGGLYSRFAVSVLPFKFVLPESEAKVVLHPNVFITAATPHLGVASHTYFIIPRFLEHLIGAMCGKTGQDFFRTNRRKRRRSSDDNETALDVIYAMGTKDRFLAPLSAFRHRIAYINAFGSDMQVPAATAGMLSEYGDYPHHFREDLTYQCALQHIDASVFQTKQERETFSFSNRLGSWSLREREIMANNLSSLGWTKLFVDCRKGIPSPGLPLPRSWRSPRKEKFRDMVDAKREESLTTMERNQVVMTSKELYSIMTKSDQIQMPLGHFVLVAHSKTSIGVRQNAKGRPIMDSLASNLIRNLED